VSVFVVVYLVIDSVRKLMDIPSYMVYIITNWSLPFESDFECQ